LRQPTDGRAEHFRTTFCGHANASLADDVARSSRVTTTGTAHGRDTVSAKFSEYESSTQSRAAANRHSLSHLTTVRGRRRTQSAIRHNTSISHPLSTNLAFVTRHSSAQCRLSAWATAQFLALIATPFHVCIAKPVSFDNGPTPNYLLRTLNSKSVRKAVRMLNLCESIIVGITEGCPAHLFESMPLQFTHYRLFIPHPKVDAVTKKPP